MSVASEIQRLQSAKVNIKSAIENKGVTVGDGTIDTYAAKISEISGGGGGSVVDIVPYLKTATFTSLNVFGKKEVELNFDSITEARGMFNITEKANQNTIVEKLTINCSRQITSIMNMFYCNGANWLDETLKHLTLNVDTQKCTAFSNAFNGMSALEIIDGQPLDFSSVTNVNYMSAFNGVPKIVEFRVVSNSIKLNFNISKSPNLSTDTIQSIIDGLADLTGGTAQTLTLHATVGAKLTETQKATITAKNWTLVY